jgi:SAM-dependent methyltransferase
MSLIEEQYDAYPYPERDPADEAKRLITGSPSHPLEIDHFVFAGRRDWTQPLRALVAGGGTGDALIQMAQILTNAGRPFEITYMDLSVTARGIAEARARARGLSGIEFITGSLLDAARHGPFDYIDCCGVLHHLPEPQAGFNALAQALKPEGGIGVMVYAPYGRSGVYPLQEAFGAMLQGSPQDRLRTAKEVYARLPETHPFKCNPHLGDHHQSDAGFYDLLLHSQDRAFSIRELTAAFTQAGLAITGLPQAYAYDPTPLLPDPRLLVGLDAVTRMEIAEKLRGTIKLHVAYAAPAENAEGRMAKPTPQSVPHLKGVKPAQLAEAIARRGVLPINVAGEKLEVPVSAAAAALVRRINGRANLADIARAERLDPIAFSALWNGVSETMCTYGLMFYSSLLR